MTRQELPRLTALRAFAAGAVFLCHVQLFMGWHPADVFRDGYSGVSFFFILSGFVLTWSRSAAGQLTDFYRRRFARVWPTHFVVLVALIVATRPYVPVGPSVASMLLVQSWVPVARWATNVNGVSWSLSCEAAFYAVWPVLLAVFVRRGLRTAWVLAGAGYVVLLVLTALRNRLGSLSLLPYVFPPVRLPEFAMGVALALAMERGWRLRAKLWQVVGGTVALALFLRAFEWPVDIFPGLLLDGAFLLVIASAVGLDIDDRPGILRRPLLQYLGKISFAFYLVHVVVLQHLPKVLHVRVDGAPAVLCVAVASTAVAVALHHVVELPMNRRLRQRHDTPVSV